LNSTKNAFKTVTVSLSQSGFGSLFIWIRRKMR
jgi:hypothetical protein